jgi:hypothetical protein
MKSTASDFGVLRDRLEEIQEGLREQELDGWLLYDLHARNPVAGKMIGVGDLTRRYFVLIPASGEPIVLMHGIETTPWDPWPWQQADVRVLEEPGRAAGGAGRRPKTRGQWRSWRTTPSPPWIMIPAGVADLLRKAGAELTSLGRPHHPASTPAGRRRGSRPIDRAAGILAEVARATFRAGGRRRGRRPPHHGGRAAPAGSWTSSEESGTWARGRTPSSPTAINAANPHYENGPEGATAPEGGRPPHRPLVPGVRGRGLRRPDVDGVPGLDRARGRAAVLGSDPGRPRRRGRVPP